MFDIWILSIVILSGERQVTQVLKLIETIMIEKVFDLKFSKDHPYTPIWCKRLILIDTYQNVWKWYRLSTAFHGSISILYEI